MIWSVGVWKFLKRFAFRGFGTEKVRGLVFRGLRASSMFML